MSDQYKYMEFVFDDGRLQRSRDIVILGIDIDGNTLPNGHYMAIGGSSTQRYCSTNPVSCDCPDFEWGDHRLCKHIIAALLFEKDILMLSLIPPTETHDE